MKFDLSRFKKVSSTKESTTLKHPDGHSITIAHSPLSPKMREQVASLPMSGGKEAPKAKSTTTVPIQHMAEGGVKEDLKTLNAADYDDASTYAKAFTALNPGVSEGNAQAQFYIDKQAQAPLEIPKGVSTADAIAAKEAEPKTDVVTPPQAAQVEAPAQPISAATSAIPGSPVAPAGAPVTGGSQGQASPMAGANSETAALPDPTIESAYKNQVAGIAGEGAAKSALGNSQAAILKQSLPQQQQAIEHAQQTFAAATQEYNHFIDDYKNGHIDPDHYLNSQGTGEKISTAIGLILGGIGGGLTHQENPALKFLNQQIDRDVMAQQAELGKKENLLSANLKHFGDLKTALEFTAAQQRGIVQTQLEQAAAKAQSPLARAAAQQAIGALEGQNAQVFQNAAMRKTLEEAQKQGNNLDPASFVPYLPNASEADKKQILKEIGDKQNINQIKDQYMKHFDDAAKENTVVKSIGGLRTPASILSMQALMLPIIHDKEGRVNEFEQHTTNSLMPQPGDTSAKVAAKRQATLEFLNQKGAAPTAKSHGLDLDKFQSTTSSPLLRLPPQQRQYAEWAKANPNDPKAQLVLKKLGIQ